ncbi:glycoside hydrolase family 3 N-terminal domain-containing protein [Fulvivirgaceae bacterium BMA12]|uniref:beta-N-acetylhexosaminidase n=1 Tax=Agaribacillus aureus TaxID=3051825 RepID=A0ABT8LEV1_9BACT|nr:glycoside hydrolase family 3 N-terminal domain-containing protein [Fulvivirgaceae bacterium BMA12]
MNVTFDEMKGVKYHRAIVKKIRRIAAYATVTITLCYCTDSPSISGKNDVAPAERQSMIRPAFLSVDHSWADSILSTLTLEEKIGQLIMIRAFSNQGAKHKAEIEKHIEEYKIGGLIFFQGGPVRQAKLTNRYQTLSKIPLFIAIDGEWGLGMRLDSTLSYPYQMSLGAIQDNGLIKVMSEDMGQQFKRLGIHWNLAPVVDINNNPNNPVINFRSFGEDKHNVVLKGHNYIAGLEASSILTSLKHFPGHGDTHTDSHKALPNIDHDFSRLEDIELFPFIQLIQKGAGTIMAAHLNIPALDSTSHGPTSLSEFIINELLKGQMGFEGLVISDAMDMKGLTDHVEKGKAAVMALKAGNDIIELVEDLPLAVQSIKEAVVNHQISVDDIDEKCKKVLLAKYWTGLFRRPFIQLDNLYNDLNKGGFDSLIVDLYRGSATLLENRDSLLFRLSKEPKSIAALAVGPRQPSSFVKNMATSLNAQPMALPRYASKAHIRQLKKAVAKNDYVLLALHQLYNRPGIKLGYGRNTRSFIEELLSTRKVLLVNFRSPYILAPIKHVEKAKIVLLNYQDNETTRKIAMEILSGKLGTFGKLPVTINERWQVGDGITVNK